MVNINAQEYIDKKYPKHGICQRKEDKENLNKKREDITKLDLSKGSLGKHFWGGEGEKVLFGSLKIEGFTHLKTLIISSHQLISLDVSDCSKLETLDCSGNKVDSLNVNGCFNLKKINCSGNDYLKELDLSACTYLREADINGCLELSADKIRSHLVYDAELGKLIKSGLKIAKAKGNDIRNILIIGITGSGKSALANTLSGISHFTEGSWGISITKHFQTSDVFEWQGKKYRVIDNIGFNDAANISNEDILFKIGEGIHAAKEGINQILFVFRGRFSKDKIYAFNLFKDFIAESGITKFTTIIRAGFEEFQDLQLCAKDKELLINEAKVISEIISSCNGIIHIDNPPIPVIKESDSEKIKTRNRQRASLNKEKREISRERVLKHLSENCSETYKLKEWDSIYSMVDNYAKKKEWIKKRNSSNMEKELQQEKDEFVEKVDKSIKGSIGISIPYIPIEFDMNVEYDAHIETPIKIY